MPLEVQGIDRDERSRSMIFEQPQVPEQVARDLYNEGWKWAVLVQDGVIVGGVYFDSQKLARTWWGDPE
jgi:hypothetical protein